MKHTNFINCVRYEMLFTLISLLLFFSGCSYLHPGESSTHITKAVILAGDSVSVTLSTGADAPCDGTPYPVIFKTESGIIHTLSGTQSVALSNANIYAAVQGSLTDSRALFRLVSLTFSLPNGERKNIKVDGWIVGDDGIRGIEGEAINPMGNLLKQGVCQVEAQSKLNDKKATQQKPCKQKKNKNCKCCEAIRKYSEYMAPQVRIKPGQTGTAIFSTTSLLWEENKEK